MEAVPEQVAACGVEGALALLLAMQLAQVALRFQVEVVVLRPLVVVQP